MNSLNLLLNEKDLVADENKLDFGNTAIFTCTDSNFEDIKFDNLFAIDFNIARCVFKKVQFANCNISGSFFWDCEFHECDFINCEAKKISLNGSFFTNCKFINSDFYRADIIAVTFNHTIIEDINFQSAIIIDTTFDNIPFTQISTN